MAVAVELVVVVAELALVDDVVEHVALVVAADQFAVVEC